jgi:mannosyltransferase
MGTPATNNPLARAPRAEDTTRPQSVWSVPSNVVPSPASWVERRSLLVLLGIILLAFVLRVVRLDQASLWSDEIWSIAISRLPWQSFFWTVRNQDPNMSIYYALLHVWTWLGDSESIVRALSVLTGVATLPAVYALGVRLFDKKVALIASTLFALNAFHIQWSQEARSYGLLVLLVTLSSLFFATAIERPSARAYSFYVLTSTLAMYAHVYAVLVLVAQWASLLFLKRRQVPWKGLFYSGVAIGLLAFPLGLLILERARHPWLPMGWLPQPSLRGVYDIFYALAGNADFPGSHGGKALLMAYAAVSLWPILSWAQAWRTNGRSIETWRTAFLISWLFVPIAMALAISFTQPMLMNRYLLLCMPALVLIAGRGIRSIKWPAISVVGLIILGGLAAQRLPQYYDHRASFQQWKSVTDYILQKAEPEDAAIFCVAPGKLLFEFYRERYYPSSRQIPVLYPEPRDARSDPRALDYLPPMDSAALRSAAKNHRRVWFVIYHDTFSTTQAARDSIAEVLAENYPYTEKTRFNGVTVVLYSRENNANRSTGTF